MIQRMILLFRISFVRRIFVHGSGYEAPSEEMQPRLADVINMETYCADEAIIPPCD